MTLDIEKLKEVAPVTLAECPIGLFRAGNELCLKTEYGNNEGRIDAYIVSSGEFFCGTAPQSIENQRRQMVVPVSLDDLDEIRAQRDEAMKMLATSADEGIKLLRRAQAAEAALAPFVDVSVQSSAAAVALNTRILDGGLCEVKVLKSQFVTALNLVRARP